MSAYIVSNKHINTILSGANRSRLDEVYINKFKLNDGDLNLVPAKNFDGNYLKFDLSQLDDLQTLATVLLNENYRSVNYRYREQSQVEPIKFQFEPVTSLIQVIKLIDCLDYQSCETDDWESSLAFKLLSKIKDQMVGKMLDAAGYSDLKWSI